jgi:hypothetical protein
MHIRSRSRVSPSSFGSSSKFPSRDSPAPGHDSRSWKGDPLRLIVEQGARLLDSQELVRGRGKAK